MVKVILNKYFTYYLWSKFHRGLHVEHKYVVFDPLSNQLVILNFMVLTYPKLLGEGCIFQDIQSWSDWAEISCQDVWQLVCHTFKCFCMRSKRNCWFDTDFVDNEFPLFAKHTQTSTKIKVSKPIFYVYVQAYHLSTCQTGLRLLPSCF
jgi:hypothetical protein